MKIDEGIKYRNRYLQAIEPFMGQSIIKVMTGQRRVGKSYILFQLMELIKQKEPNANIIYINLEDMAFDFIVSAKELHTYIVGKCLKDRKNYIFIDEIQDINEFEKALRSLALDVNNDIYVTGSNAKMLSGELATYLGGRYIEFTIYSLSYPEFLQFHGLEDSDDSFDLYSKYGGLPYLMHLKLEDRIVFEYLESIYSTIVYRDIVSRYALRNTVFLEKLLLFLADNVGSIFSAKGISDYLKSQQISLGANQILSYIDYFENAFIIHNVSRYDIAGKRIFEIGNKYYFENLGIRNVITGRKLQDRAKVLENIVYNHLRYLGYAVKVGVLEKLEVDFIGEKNGEKLYVQVALRLDDERTVEREFGNLLKIEDNYPKLVVSQDRFEGNTYEGIRHMYIRDFLMRD
jgi:predicted ATPase (AAA+ superfamily)